MRMKTAVLGLAVGALLATAFPTAPASAATTLTFTMWASASVSGSFGSPCTGLKTCPPATSTTPGTDGFGLPVTYLSTTGNTRAFGWGAIFCFDSGVNKGKAAKPPALGGPCALSGSGVVTGHCALATGTGSSHLTDSLGQSYSVSWTLTWSGPTPEVSTITLTGTATKSSNGRTGAFRATFVAQLVQGSCLDKTAAVWHIYGEGLVRILN